MNRLVAIDLGTTNSTGHMWLTEQVCSIDWNNSSLFPSNVVKHATGIIACDTTEKPRDPFVRNFKRLLGQTYEEYLKMKYDEGTFGCEVICGADGNPRFKLNETCILSPEEVAAEVIKHIMHQAKIRNDKVDTVIVTIPANYSSRQKKATLKAVELAGYKCYGLLPEPTAAALSYLLKDTRETSTFLVYDLGGGTFDVSLLEYRDDKIRILQTNGDIHLGGNDFDVALMEAIIKEYESVSGKHLFTNKKRAKLHRAKLLLASKGVKEGLCTTQSKDIDLTDIFGDDVDEEYRQLQITQSMLNSCISNYIERTWKIVDETIAKEAKKRETLSKMGEVFSVGNITKILLVGGSSQLPLVLETMKKRFNESMIVKVNKMTCVGEGAFYHVVNMNNSENHITVQTSLGCALGLGVDKHLVYRMFPQFSNIPCSRYVEVKFNREQQDTVKTALFEGKMDEQITDSSLCSLVSMITLPLPRGAAENDFILHCELEDENRFILTCLDSKTRKSLSSSVTVEL